MEKYLAVVFVLVVLFMAVWLGWEYMPVCGVEYADAEVASSECECLGWELVLRDDLEAGGVRKTTCLGVMKQSKCYKFEGDEMKQIECE